FVPGRLARADGAGLPVQDVAEGRDRRDVRVGEGGRGGV
ncbi:MAG: hypothetical protein AVDCRST_MAG13-3663, partial [uncultured Solirubrobacteraceae bacterium]